jgi:hypothetical protein
MRLYPTERCLAAEIGVTQPTIDEALGHTVRALFDTIVPSSTSSCPLPHRGYREGVLAGVRLVVDSTFLILPHMSDLARRKPFYHPKSPTRQALKWQLAVTTDGHPWHISEVVHGSKADITLLRESGLLDLLHSDTTLLGDKGYIGAPNTVTPKKKRRDEELKEEEKKDNKVVYRARAVVENCHHEFKRWAVLGGEWRGAFEEEDDWDRVSRIVHVVGAMVKRRLAAHPLRRHPEATI